MTCSGLHCPGCSAGQSLGVAGGIVLTAVLAAEMSAWVADRIWWIGGTLAACFALAVAASMALETRSERRGARFAAAHGILSRADLVLPEPVRAVAVERAASRPAIAPALTINFYGADTGAAAAHIIRQAIPGTAGDAITERE